VTHVIVCGGREYHAADRVTEVLGEHVVPLHPHVTVHHGDAPGADRLADLFCASARISCIAHPADWKRHSPNCGAACRARSYCVRAGPRRNAEMLAAVLVLAGGPERVRLIAFPGGSGTADMTEIARRAGVRVVEVSW
jgi:hypothetical protein